MLRIAVDSEFWFIHYYNMYTYDLTFDLYTITLLYGERIRQLGHLWFLVGRFLVW